MGPDRIDSLGDLIGTEDPQIEHTVDIEDGGP